jgi:rhodanese-related sulfurtransferase
MSTTLTRESVDAVSFFKAKLEFETGPYGVSEYIKKDTPVTIVDLRMPENFAKGHVPGAKNIQLDELDKNLSHFDKNKTIVVYCYNITCHLAARAALHLAEKGYKVQEMVGGWQEWEQAGLAKAEGQHEAASCSTAKGSSCH